MNADRFDSAVFEPVKTLLDRRSFGEIKKGSGCADTDAACKKFFHRVAG